MANKVSDLFKVGSFKHEHGKGRTVYASMDTKKGHRYAAVGKHEGKPLAAGYISQKKGGDVNAHFTKGFRK